MARWLGRLDAGTHLQYHDVNGPKAARGYMLVLLPWYSFPASAFAISARYTSRSFAPVCRLARAPSSSSVRISLPPREEKKESGPPPVQGNYMAYRGGLLRFGKLTMTDSDMILIDMNPRDPFDFSLDHYNDQLVAGYTKNTPQHGLRVFMPDFYTLRKPTSKGSPKAPQSWSGSSR